MSSVAYLEGQRRQSWKGWRVATPQILDREVVGGGREILFDLIMYMQEVYSKVVTFEEN